MRTCLVRVTPGRGILKPVGHVMKLRKFNLRILNGLILSKTKKRFRYFCTYEKNNHDKFMALKFVLIHKLASIIS